MQLNKRRSASPYMRRKSYRLTSGDLVNFLTFGSF